MLSLNECLPKNHAYLGPLLGMQVFGVSTGELLAIIVGTFLLTDLSIPWQYFLIAMSLPMVIVILLAPFLLDETPQFLLSKGKTEEALKVLNKIARMNNSFIPDDINLTLRKSCEKKFDKERQWTVFRTTMKNWAFLKVWLPLLLIAVVVKMISDGLSFVITELLYVNGENVGEYCNGVTTQTYNLTRDDYTKLCFTQICIVVSIAITYPILKLNIALKIQGLIFFSINCILILAMYFCLRVLAAISILAFVRININVILATSRYAQLKLKVPAEVQGTIFGLSGGCRSVLVPFFPLLVQSLSKTSIHYVTTICLVVTLIGILAFISLPFDLSKDFWEKEPLKTDQIEMANATTEEKTDDK